MATLIGQQRGNFKLTQLLGQGGFAEVYLGENIYARNNKVAIKILNTHLDEKGIRQFTGEANTLTSLRHPHIIQVTDFGFDNNIPYLIMEYAPNGTLVDRHPLGAPIPIATVVGYVKQVADALQYAHNNKIIHRDVKPANMLIGANNSILLSDFGIARVVQTYTIGTKDIAGSFEYMSPEQGKVGAGAVFASDQYSLGVVAYQWLCGNLPFQGEGAQLMYQHRMDPPPPFPATLHISPSVENMIKKALAKEPDQRFTNVQEFAATLEQASKDKVYPTQIPSPNRAPQPGKLPTRTEPAQSSSNIDIDALYRQGVEAYAKGEETLNTSPYTSPLGGDQQKVKDFFEQAEQSWQQTLTVDPNYMSGTLKTRFTNLQQRLHPIRVQELRRQAGDHHRTGRWQEAIQTWETLLKLEPEDAEAQKNIATARHNMQYVGMYATAQQFVQESKFAAARVELAELKIYAPEYGDPAGLAQRLGPQPVQPFIQQAPAYPANQPAPVRQSGSQPAQLIEQAPYYRRNKRQDRIDFVKSLGMTNIEIWLYIFLLLSGTGVASGLIARNWISQSWIVAIGIVAILALVTYGFSYRKVTSPFPMVVLTLLSLAVVFAVTWYTSKINYNSTEISSFWFAARHLWIGRQISLGLIIGIVPYVVLYFFTIISRSGETIPLIDDLIYHQPITFKSCLFLLAISITFVAILYIILGGLELFLGGRLGVWGWGFGFGWYFTWLSALSTLLAEAGIMQFLEIVME